MMFASGLMGQGKMEVLRTKAVDRYVPVTNVYTDEEGNRWAGNRNGLFQVLSPEQGMDAGVKPGEWSLLQTPGGNADYRIPLDALLSQLGEAGTAIQARRDRITAATMDTDRQELWIGTRESGLYQLRTSPALQLIQRHHSGNSKLASNTIHALMSDNQGRLWVGTEEGCVFGKAGKWRLEEKLFSITAFARNETNVWVLGSDLLWRVDAREAWTAVELPEELSEGELVDIAFDNLGRLWIASQVISWWDPATEESYTFGPAQEFTSQQVACLDIDRDNTVWIGTRDKGLYAIRKADVVQAVCTVAVPLRCGSAEPTAALRVTVSGGEAPYSYRWNRPELEGAQPAGLGPGTYTVTVTDARGKSQQAGITVTDPNLTLVLSQVKPVDETGGENGSATVSVTGGRPPYTYRWDAGETTATANRLGEGTHAVTVTDDAGCTASAAIRMDRILAELSIETETVEAIDCAGAATGILAVNVRGGKQPYAVRWSSGGDALQANGLAAGSYGVTVTDAAGNTAAATHTLTAPAPLTLSAKVLAPATVQQSTGQATVQTDGGNGVLQYRWDNNESTPTATQLSAGVHQVTVTDAKGCTATASVDIPENILPLQVNLAQEGSIRCPGDATARLRLSVSGGKGPFRFTWTGGTTDESRTDLPAGDYEVTVSDAEGATATAAYTITEPQAFDLTLRVEAPATTGQADGKASVRVKGGTGQYRYQWDNGATETLATQLSPGSHAVTITDEAGCSSSASVDIPENILPLQVSLSPAKEIPCAGSAEGAILATVTDGKPPYRLTWSDGGQQESTRTGLLAGTYAVTVSDDAGNTATATLTLREPAVLELSAAAEAPATTNLADGKAAARAKGGTGNYRYAWDNAESAAQAVRLAPGTRQVTVTDANGCTAVASVDITENILPLSADLAITAAIRCHDTREGAITVMVSGGKPPYRTTWSDGQPGMTAEGLPAGTYTVTVTDALGTQLTRQQLLEAPAPLLLNARVEAPASTDGTDGRATAEASGGSRPYVYEWDNGERETLAVRLSPGQHSVNVRDDAGCTATATVAVTENILPLQGRITQTADIRCAGESTAALAISADGGKGPYRFNWSDGQEGPVLDGLPAGSYKVVVTDALGTTTSLSAQVKAPDPLEITITKTRPATTLNQANGKAFVRSLGGTGDLSYQWDNGEAVPDAIALAAGPHTLTVRDANGCTATATCEIGTRIIPELSAADLRDGEIIKLEKIYFQPDSTQMEPGSIPTVDELFEFLSENPGIVIEVGGHTNGIPPHEFCDRLSSARARSVAQYLVDKGLPTSRITYRGYGKRNPIASNATPEGRARNQRVEIKIVRMEGD
ncbi:MAG: hypothetical protein RLY31_2682 [Bacteroidota bacterium]